MSMPRTFLSILAGFMFSMGLQAQIEPQLRTVTDSLDVYKTDASQANAICVFDFSTPSRAIFESPRYLTENGRDAYLTSSLKGLGCGDITIGKDYGVLFLLQKGTNNVYLYRWAQSQDFLSSNGWTKTGTFLPGTPYNFNASATGTLVTAQATDSATIDLITHVRFTIGGRTVDLPCPTKIWDCPYASDPNSARQPLNTAVLNYQHGATTATVGTKTYNVTYDPWSNTHTTGTDPSNQTTGTDPTPGLPLPNIPSNYLPIGNFYYSFDYLAWIFSSKQIGNGFSPTTAPTSGNYASPNGYAVPSTNETTTVPGVGSVNAVGWYNGLPVMARYQADKVAAINVFLNNSSVVNLVYRFMDSRNDNPSNSEEGGTGWISTSAPNDPSRSQAAIWSDTTVANRKYFRRLTTDASTGLPTNKTSIQAMGPSAWNYAYPDGTSSFYHSNSYTDATGNNTNCVSKQQGGNLDPWTPAPWSYNLINTYYRANVEPAAGNMKDIFPDYQTSCPSQNYVIIFPTGALSDSTSVASPYVYNEDASNTYSGAVPPGNGQGAAMIKGNYPGAPNACGNPSTAGTLLPTDSGSYSFHPGVLASVAAFATTSTASNSYQWGAPWMRNPTQTRSSKNPGLQTMVMGVGIPGWLYSGSSHNLRTTVDHFFKIAQWSDPQRTDLKYGFWKTDKPGPGDTSVIDPVIPGKVHYYPAGSPSQLEANFASAIAFIVAGSASLSAPATPSTGARVTSQAYFGIFRTSRSPVWSGNLYSVGIKFTVDATKNVETMSFYDAAGNSTIAQYTPVDNNNQPILDANGNPLVVTGTNDFDGHHLWSAFDIFGNYLATDYAHGVTPQTAGVAGSPLLWSARKVYTLDSSNTMVSFSQGNNALVSSLVSSFAAANLFPSGDSLSQTNRVKAFINFILGQNRNASHTDTNRVDLMGDIVDSSPLAIELSSTNLAGLPGGITWPSGGTDPHVRLILVGTNMGQLHCFAESAYKDSNGNVQAKATEAWAFIPPDVMNTLFKVYLNDGINDIMPHTYTVDGNPTLFWTDLAPSGSVIGNTRVDANEDGIVIFGMRKGGRSRYALSITAKNNSGAPGQPAFLWKLDPNTSSDPTVQKMGASSGDPAFGYYSTNGNPSTATAVAFITGGYANPEINARYRAKTPPTIGATQGMGQSVLAINPYNGAVIKEWDWSSNTTIGSIPGAATPLGIFPASPLIYRLYFADMKGNVMALDTSTLSSGTVASGYRLDTSIINNWNTTPRFIYSNPAFRFSSRPEVTLLNGGYPVPIAKINGSTTANYRPMTAMVAIGAGDWNNPTDTDESVTDATIALKDAHPPATNRLFVFADRQDSSNVGTDTTGILDSSLQEIKDTTDSAFNWTTTYSDARVTPGSSTYLFRTKTGYYYDLLDATLPGAYNGITHDKVLVSPLMEGTVIFFSLFDINGNTGFQCSSNAFTRTFRQCDLLRPLAINSQVQQKSTVSDINTLNLNSDACNGLAFYFNSLASEMSVAGDRVIQGGAVTASSGSSFSSQTGANTASLQESREAPGSSGLQLRSWRISY